jgi:hypothetical protein
VKQVPEDVIHTDDRVVTRSRASNVDTLEIAKGFESSLRLVVRLNRWDATTSLVCVVDGRHNSTLKN